MGIDLFKTILKALLLREVPLCPDWLWSSKKNGDGVYGLQKKTEMVFSAY